VVSTELAQLGVEVLEPKGGLAEQLRPILPQVPTVVQPRTAEEVAAILTCSQRQRWRVLPMGAGTKLGWGGRVQGADLILNTAKLNRVIEHCAGDLTVTVEAGVTIQSLQALLAQAGQHLALDPAFADRATVGGMLATGETGSLRQRYGGVRDMVLGIEFVRSDGERSKAGGRVVKNVAGYDLMKLFTGSWGTLGVVTQITFRLYPLPLATQSLILTGTASQITEALTKVLASPLTPTIVDILSSDLIKALDLGQGWGFVLQFQGFAQAVQAQVKQVQELVPGFTTIELKTSVIQAHIHQGVTAKVGLPPASVVSTLVQMEKLAPLQALVHAGRGVGYLKLAANIDASSMLRLRALVQEQGGYLTILEASAALKQQLDVWGYSGNGLDLMRRIKQQFDPLHLLSPGRFVGGI